jgi:hypothetical protein
VYVLLALANALVVAVGIWRAGLRRPFALLLWLFAAGFAAYPFVVDAFFLAIGKIHVILELYASRADGVAPVLDQFILTRTCAFVLTFNLVLLFFLEIGYRQRPARETGPIEVSDVARTAAVVMAIGGMVALIYIVQYEFDGIQAALAESVEFFGIGTGQLYEPKHSKLRALANTLVYASPFATYVGLICRRHVLALAGAIPCVFLAYITAQRPWLFCVFGVVFLYVVGPGRGRLESMTLPIASLKSAARRTVAGLLVFACALFLAYFVRLGRADRFRGSASDAVAETIASVLSLRDVSIFVLYWTMDMVPDRLSTTNGMSTMHIPATILQLPMQFTEMEQVGYYLAWYRSRWTTTTTHPTIYGWAYCDLAWGGVIWGLFLALMIRSVEWWTGDDESRHFAAAPIMTMMLAVVMRGSPHYGITRGWYGMLYVVALFSMIAIFAGQVRSHEEPNWTTH